MISASRLPSRAAFAVATSALVTLLLPACSSKPTAASSDAGADGPPWAIAAPDPPPRPGMVWIPAGPLVAGMPIGKSPHVPDEEMNGEQIAMNGFYVDVYLFPNEPGALPKVGVTQAEATELCAAKGKRLCTELELERACKGPQNTVYEYGESYRASACNVGSGRPSGPNGMNAACESGFGVFDLHGSAWSWTSSPWNRDPKKTGLVAIRGGNGVPGELVGRCANGRGARPDTKSQEIGFRCCGGDRNPFEVTVSVAKGEPLSLLSPDGKISKTLETLAKGFEGAPEKGHFTVDHLWIWRPFGNEEVWVGGGCAETIKTKRGKKRRAGCGIMIARPGEEAPVGLLFIDTDRYRPTLTLAESSRYVFLYGGDQHGAFRRKLTYDWGKITVGEKARKKKGKGDVYE